MQRGVPQGEPTHWLQTDGNLLKLAGLPNIATYEARYKNKTGFGSWIQNMSTTYVSTP